MNREKDRHRICGKVQMLKSPILSFDRGSPAPFSCYAPVSMFFHAAGAVDPKNFVFIIMDSLEKVLYLPSSVTGFA